MLTGKQNAALLLMSLDTFSATELLKSLKPEKVQELAMEVAYLETAGYQQGNQESFELAKRFYNELQTKSKLQSKDFLKETLKNTVGDEKAKQIQSQIQDYLKKRDPFLPIRSVSSQTMASALENEHPQAVAVVLSEMPARKSSEILSILGEGIRISSISRMTQCDKITQEAKARIAETINKKLQSMTSSGGAATAAPVKQEQSLRKTAVILRSLSKELRDTLINSIKEKDKETAETVTRMMIVWEDIPQITDRSLQNALRGIEMRKLALALIKANENISSKIKANISERAAATLAEETSLMSAPKKEDIEQARESVVAALREINQKGELSFVEE